MKTAGDAEAGEGEASAAAKAAAALCCAGAEARVSCPVAERVMLAAGAARARKAVRAPRPTRTGWEGAAAGESELCMKRRKVKFW